VVVCGQGLLGVVTTIAAGALVSRLPAGTRLPFAAPALAGSPAPSSASSPPPEPHA
jgi:hypothetical protein